MEIIFQTLIGKPSPASPGVSLMCAGLMLAELTMLMRAELSKHHADATDDLSKFEPKNRTEMVAKSIPNSVELRSKLGPNSVQIRSKFDRKSVQNRSNIVQIGSPWLP